MNRTRIKICGFTTPEQAAYAAYAGVDAIGLVFYPPSPRNVSIELAQKIVQTLPAFTTVVALFVDASKAEIKQVTSQVRIDLLQFHGNESPEACRQYSLPYMKAVRMQANTDIDALSKSYHDASALLLDAYHPQTKGGTGEKFDWDLIPKKCSLPIVLAGGLDKHNAGQAIHQVQPFALDISSGVESAKGIKDNNKVSEFLTEVYQSDRNN